jgi:uncharacterized protein (TIGR02268 family)
MGTGATAAQPQARERTERKVVLSGSSSDSVHPIRVAPGVVTTLTFEDTAIDARTLQLEGRGSRVKLVGAEEHTIVLKPLVELAQGERLLLRVPFADGRTPTHATFALVSHPSEVDSQVEVIRQPQSAEACQDALNDMQAQLARKDAELQMLRARAAASGPAGLIIAGLLDDGGVTFHRSEVAASPEVRSGLMLMHWGNVRSFRASKWAAVTLEARNRGELPWTPGMAKLMSMETGKPVTVVSVSMKPQQLAPGESTLVVVETEPPPEGAGEPFALELLGADGGRALSISGVRFPNPRKDVKP